MNSLEETVEAILERNKRVEADKAWEVSFSRRITLFLLTYITAALVLWSIGSPEYLLSAIIPAGAYILSTLSLPYLKKWWIEKRFSKW